MITTVIFDMDGVLIDSEPVYLEAMLEFGQHKRPELLEKDICAIVGRDNRFTTSCFSRFLSKERTQNIQ